MRESHTKPTADGRPRVLRSLGLGIITGAADDDPSAIGTYASAGAKLGPSFLWIAPLMFPMMFAVVYLSARLGQVTGQGLFEGIRKHFSRWIVYPALIGALIGNTIEAGADLGGMAAAINLLVPIPILWIVLPSAAAILVLQFWGSYTLIRNIFRWLALSLLAYIGAAILARPQFLEILKGTLIPALRFDREFLSLVVAVIGASLSPYIYTWQSNEEVEEEIAIGRTKLSERRGASDDELTHSRWDTLFGMSFSSLVMYFIMLSTGVALFKSGKTDISSAAQAAQALRPLAGNAAGLLFAIGLVAVGFLAVPVMTTGAAYNLAQTFGWKHGLHARPREARKFYAAIAAVTVLAASLNFLGINPMRALVLAGIVQGFSAPPLILLIVLMTSSRKIMGDRVNSRALKALGWGATAVISAATAGLVVIWII